MASLGQYNEAIKWYDKALTLEPNATYILFNKGNAFSNLGQQEEAIKWYDKAITLEPNATHVLFNMANALANLSQYIEATKLYDRIIAENSNVDTANERIPMVISYRGLVHITQKDVITSNSTLVDALFNKAYVLAIGLKKYNEALDLTQSNLETHPTHKGLLCLTAEIYKQVGLQGLASRYEDQLLHLDKNYTCRLIQIPSIDQVAFI